MIEDRPKQLIVVAAVCGWVLHVAALAVTPADSIRLALNIVFTILFGVFAAGCLAWSARRSRTMGGRMAWGWGLMAAGAAVFAVGDVVGLVQAGVPGGLRGTAIRGDAAGLPAYILFLAGLFLLPAGSVPRYGRIRWALDLMILVSSTVLLFWSFVFAPLFESAGGLSSIVLGAALLYMTADATLLWGVVAITMRTWQQAAIPALRLLVAGCGVLVIVQWVSMVGAASGRLLQPSFLDAGWTLFYLLLGLAGVWQINLSAYRPGSAGRRPSPDGVPGPLPTPPGLLQRRLLDSAISLPTVGLVAAFFSLVSRMGHLAAGPIDDGLVVAWISLIIGLSITRQVLAFRDNSRLYRRLDEELEHTVDIEQELRLAHEELEARVAERTAELAVASRELEAEVRVREQAIRTLSESEANLRAIFDTGIAAYMLIDLDGAVRAFNALASEWLQRLGGRGAEIGQPIRACIPAAYMDMLRGIRLSAMEGRQIRQEVAIRDADGARRWYDLGCFPVLTDQHRITGVCFAVWDITERKQGESERDAMGNLAYALRNVAGQADTLSVMLQHIQTLTAARGVAVIARDPTSGDEVCLSAIGDWTSRSGRRIAQGVDIVSRVLESGRAYVANPSPERGGAAPGAAPGAPKLELTQGILALACVPMVTQGSVVGAIWVGRDEPITDDTLRALQGVCDIAAGALQRAVLFDEAQRRVQRMAALRTIDQAVTSSMDVRVTLNLILQQAMQHLEVDAAAVWILGVKTRDLRRVCEAGLRTARKANEALLPVTVRLGDEWVGRTAVERRLVGGRIESTPGSPGALSAGERRLIEEGVVSYYGVPMLAKGEVKGVLELLYRREWRADREWVEFAETLAGQAAIAFDNAEMFEQLQRSNVELSLAYDTTLEGWARALEMRDQETEGHARRVVDLTVQLCRALGISDADLVHVRRGALLHDIGKMAVPDAILLKPAPLTESERETMKQHTVYAMAMLSPIRYLQPALDIPWCHHERWDGAGYPRGLAGQEIPLAARAFAVIDAWDALTHDRSYKRAWTVEQARQQLQVEAGHAFDPRVVDVFLALKLA